MRILHYTIGFAPERTGGLVSYATDLMLEQIRIGHDVYALYPGNQLIFGKSPKVKNSKEKKGIKTFRLINSLPLALFGGISQPDDFMKPCDSATFVKFLTKLQPEVIHIHSFIGLHKEFLEAASELGIRTVFTTHDYYGLAPLPTFYYNGVSFDEKNDNLAWNIMSADALSTIKLRIFQSSFYPTIRTWMKKLNQNPKHKKYKDINSIKEATDYSRLRDYYSEMFRKIDFFHFNSQLTESIYRQNLPFVLNGHVLSITSSKIKKHNIHKVRKDGKQVIAYIGPDEEYKGYFDFLEFIKSIDREQYDIKTYGHTPNEFAPDYVDQGGRFNQRDLTKIYSDIDYLIVPSRWKETFGLVILEALSYDVTVFASENVGAKDLLGEEGVFKTLEDFRLRHYNLDTDLKTLENHALELISFYLT
ncbi:glycosyltransferase [Streptococcus sp. NLN64]|uniref:glycosyltransferase n=1 Tax=Streptococcus sp. NLN64 TaxID=2822799 RepID=UPI0018CB1F6D|nr:glycosyltransferase [Streptococcus sp. NLN64]MBG9367198.1 glycosyltransferase [Streptococcus sp. NLN64]